MTEKILRATSEVSQSKDPTLPELDIVTTIIDSGKGKISITYPAIKDKKLRLTLHSSLTESEAR